MHCHPTILLAVLILSSEAGPVKRYNVAARYAMPASSCPGSGPANGCLRREIRPRFANTTDAPSSESSMIPPSSTSVSIPISSESSLDEKVPSRVATSETGQEKSGNDEDKASVGNGVTLEDPKTSESQPTLSTSAKIALTRTSDGGFTVTASSSTVSASTTVPSISGGSTGTSQQNSENIRTSAIPRLPNASNNVLSDTKSVRTSTSSNSESLSTAVSSQNQASTPSTEDRPTATQVSNFVDPLSAFQRARSSQTSTSDIASSGLHTEASRISSTATTDSSRVPDSIVDQGSSTRVQQADSLSATSGSTTVSDKASPSAFDDSMPSSTPLSSPTQNTITPTRYPYPDPSVGQEKMVQGYNDIYKGLNQFSECDPNDPQQVVACVSGQPGRCESDGRYSLTSCDQGETCYAVPKSNGQAGMDVQCRKPPGADDASGSSGIGGGSGGFGLSGHETTPSSISLTTSQAAPSTTNNIPQTTSTRSPRATSTLSDTSVSNVAFDTSSSGSLSSTSPVVSEIQQTSPSPISRPSTGEKAKSNGAEFPDPTATVNKSKPTPSVSSLASNDQSKKLDTQTSGHGRDSQDASGSDSGADKEFSGVQLDFPGEDDNAKDKKKSKHRESKEETDDRPHANRKNAVAAGNVPAGQVPAATSPSSMNTNSESPAATSTGIPGVSPTQGSAASEITDAPAGGYNDFKGFITVTVTKTTTVRD